MAGAAVEDKTAGTADTDLAIQQALAPTKGRPPSPWLLLRLARIGAKAGVAAESLQALAAVIPDHDLRGRARLAAFEASQGKQSPT